MASDDQRPKTALQTGKHDLLGWKYWEAKLGKRIDNWDPNASLRSRSRKDDGHADDLLRTHLAIPTFSSRFREALEYAGVATGDIQCLPIRVFQSTGKEVQGFAMANIVSRVAALNYEESSMLEQDETEIDPLTGKATVESVWKPALWAKPLEQHDIIRLVEFFPPVFVSERFVEVIREGGFTGANLEPVPVFT